MKVVDPLEVMKNITLRSKKRLNARSGLGEHKPSFSLEKITENRGIRNLSFES